MVAYILVSKKYIGYRLGGNCLQLEAFVIEIVKKKASRCSKLIWFSLWFIAPKALNYLVFQFSIWKIPDEGYFRNVHTKFDIYDFFPFNFQTILHLWHGQVEWPRLGSPSPTFYSILISRYHSHQTVRWK